MQTSQHGDGHGRTAEGAAGLSAVGVAGHRAGRAVEQHSIARADRKGCAGAGSLGVGPTLESGGTSLGALIRWCWGGLEAVRLLARASQQEGCQLRLRLADRSAKAM